MKFQEIDLTLDSIFDKIPIEIEVIFKYCFEEGKLHNRFIKVKSSNYFVFAPNLDYWNFIEEWKKDLVFGENGEPIEDIIPYFEAYSKGFLDGYFEFENEVKDLNQAFNQNSFTLETISKEIRTEAKPFSGRGYFYKTNNTGEAPIPIIRKDLLYDGGLKVGRNYKAWFYIIKNSKAFVPFFREFYFQWFKIYEDEFKKENSHDPNFSTGLQKVIEEIEALNLISKEKPNIEPEKDSKIHQVPIKSLILESNVIEPLFEGLKPYFEYREDDLKELLFGGKISRKLLWPLNQNQLVDLFKRLIESQKINHNLTEVKNFICENFYQKNGKDFNPDSVYDVLRAKSNCTKGKRILTDLNFLNKKS